MSISSLINANTHRVKEGARVLEDIARFVLRDEILFHEIRKLRHSLQTVPPDDHAQIDLGGASLKEENVRSHLIDIVQANALRIQEALRVLEEISSDVKHKQNIKSLRFLAYQLHQRIYQKTLCFTKQNQLKGLYLVIDLDVIPFSIETITQIINRSAVKLVQFRSKSSSKRDFLEKAIQFKSLLHTDKLFIINDHIDVALDIADGIHLGQDDYPLERVRKLLPDHFLVGMSCHTVQEAQLAEKAGATYISVGCLFPTTSKKDIIQTSLDEFDKIQQATHLPICAIGGINMDYLPTVLLHRPDMVAVISWPWRSSNPLSMIEFIQKKLVFSIIT